jgi:hypothetical protein
LGGQADHGAEKHFIDDQQAEFSEGKSCLRGVGGHERKENQGCTHGQADLETGGGRGAGKSRDGCGEGKDPGQAEKEILKLLNRDELQVHGR